MFRLPNRALACALVTASAGLAPACADEELPRFGTLRYESENFEVWASEGLDACGGTFDYMEGWLAAYHERIGAHANPQKHTFYWVTPEELDRGACTSGNACAHPEASTIYSTVIPMEHEIVHVEMDTQPPSVLREGAAEVFGSIRSPTMTTVVPIEPLFEDEQIPGVAYQTAGRFSRFVIDRHGIDGYFELYQALDGASGHRALATGVAETLGVGLEALVAEFESISSCTVDRWRLFDYECSTLPLTGWEERDRWVDEIDLSCAAPDVIGPRSDMTWASRHFEVANAGSYRLSIESADETAQTTIFSCDVGCFDGESSPGLRATSVATGGTTSVFLDKGGYWMRIEHAVGNDAPVTVSIER